MDQSTHDIRRAYWLDVIKRCNQRTENCSVKQWLEDNGIKNKAYYYWLRKFRREAAANMKTELPVVANEQPVMFAEIPIQSFQSTDSVESDISFKPDAVIRIKGVTLAVSNSISESLLSTLIRGVNNAC